jgi:SRSO17 transposase
MTDSDIVELGPAFAGYLRGYRDFFLQKRTANHFDNYTRGLLSDLPRKTVEPIALACGTAVRTLQEFLITADWDHEGVREQVQRRMGTALEALPDDDLGTVGVIDETSSVKKGDKTPGVQRQYLGCVGKIDNGIVTVHVGVAKGAFQALLDADLYLPESWDQDRKRCREAGIPDAVRYRPKWQIAYDQLVRLDGHGVRFDWLVFDEGYGSKVPFLQILAGVSQRFVGEVPVNFAVRTGGRDESRRADHVLTASDARSGETFRLARKTLIDARWRATSRPVTVGGCVWTLVVAINESTAEVKYLVTNATDQPLARVLAVAFRRATIEHNFRLAKDEAGMMHFEGRHWLGLVRHLILNLVVLGFVSIQTDRLRGEKSTGDAGAGVPSPEHPVRNYIPPPPRSFRTGAIGTRHPIPPAPERTGDQFTQKAAA